MMVRVRSDLEERLAAALERAGQRVTPTRRMLVEVLAAAEAPLTAPEIVSAGRGLAQSSVYRNLAVLEDAMIVRRVTSQVGPGPGPDAGGGRRPAAAAFARYELAEDLTGHHHHLTCEQCGAVADVPTSPQLERTVRAAVAEIERATGFTARTHHLDLVGRCRNCA